VRVYAPIGEMLQGMAYLVRRLLENTSNESFLRQSFAQGVAIEELLRNPLDILKEHPPLPESQPPGQDNWDQGRFGNEPLWDWTLAEHREHFAEALERTRKTFPERFS